MKKHLLKWNSWKSIWILFSDIAHKMEWLQHTPGNQWCDLARPEETDSQTPKLTLYRKAEFWWPTFPIETDVQRFILRHFLLWSATLDWHLHRTYWYTLLCFSKTNFSQLPWDFIDHVPSPAGSVPEAENSPSLLGYAHRGMKRPKRQEMPTEAGNALWGKRCPQRHEAFPEARNALSPARPCPLRQEKLHLASHWLLLLAYFVFHVLCQFFWKCLYDIGFCSPHNPDTMAIS